MHMLYTQGRGERAQQEDLDSGLHSPENSWGMMAPAFDFEPWDPCFMPARPYEFRLADHELAPGWELPYPENPPYPASPPYTESPLAYLESAQASPGECRRARRVAPRAHPPAPYEPDADAPALPAYSRCTDASPPPQFRCARPRCQFSASSREKLTCAPPAVPGPPR